MQTRHVIPPQLTPEASRGLWRRTPPAIFPPIMGLFGLGLAWRRGAEALGLNPGPAEAILGAVALLWSFAALAYGAKLARRPGVLFEDLRVLPGRAGLAALTLSGLLLAAALVPYAPGAARALLLGGLAVHAALAVAVVVALLRLPPEARGVTPVWHLSFVGFIVGGLSAAPLGLPALGAAILWTTIPAAVAIWVASLVQLVRRVPPAPLRPLLAIHLAPASLFGTVSLIQGLPMLAAVFAVLGGAILAALIGAGRWIAAAGFSPLWGAFTFPLAAYASLLLLLGGMAAWAGAALALAATVIVPWIAFRVMKAWVGGQLAVKTNAAVA